MNSVQPEIWPLAPGSHQSADAGCRTLSPGESSPEPLLILNSSTFGGIVDYLHYQANALVEKGVPVTMLGVLGTAKRADANYDYLPFWRQPSQSRFRRWRQLMFAANLTRNMHRLATFLETRSERRVLFGAYFELLAPVWAGWFRRLAGDGWRFGTVIHDPVRDHVMGPLWWHRLSIAHGYSFTSVGYIHGEVCAVADCGATKIVPVPFGPYPFPAARRPGSQVRRQLGIPDDSTVILSFGHIRDGKNVDLLQRAIVRFPSVHLVVAGTEQSSGQKPSSYYQSLAESLGIAERCHFVVRYIDESEIGEFFDAANFTALTYSASFRSASAALSACANYRRPCIASSGPGPLKEAITEYKLGVWTEPDSVDAIGEGIARLTQYPLVPEWDRYADDNSWSRNADLVIKTLC